MNKILFLSVLFVFLCNMAFAQTKTEVIPVSGDCDMCKAHILKAAKGAGVSYADWDKKTKMLTVKYDTKSTDLTKIQQSVADAGYDTRDIKASDEAYGKLASCCHYRGKADAQMVPVEKNKGGTMACCEKKNTQCCKDKMAGKKADCADKKGDCKKNAKGVGAKKMNKDCCK